MLPSDYLNKCQFIIDGALQTNFREISMDIQDFYINENVFQNIDYKWEPFVLAALSMATS